MAADLFPTLPGLGWTMTKTPMWKTLAFDATSGREARIGLRVYPRWKWTLTFDHLKAETSYLEFQQLADFVNTHYGPRDEFLFQDPTDNFIAGQLIGWGDGATKVFQLVRTLHVYGFEEPITNFNSSALTNAVYINRVAVDPGGYTISSSGILTFIDAPTDTYEISADINYYWPARFLTDDNEFDYFMHQVWEMKKLEIISLRSRDM
jgi:uncharacterized protein (TIGR02217 family)